MCQKQWRQIFGNDLEKDQISTLDSKLMAFKILPSPKTPKNLKRMVCGLGFYRKFIPSFAGTSQPLMELTTLHPKEFICSENFEGLFCKLINKMCENSVLHKLDPSKPYYVQTDASDYSGAG